MKETYLSNSSEQLKVLYELTYDKFALSERAMKFSRAGIMRGFHIVKVRIRPGEKEEFHVYTNTGQCFVIGKESFAQDEAAFARTLFRYYFDGAMFPGFKVCTLEQALTIVNNDQFE